MERRDLLYYTWSQCSGIYEISTQNLGTALHLEFGYRMRRRNLPSREEPLRKEKERVYNWDSL
jgi:hypothetical protein